jgi:hypothetical protein
VALREGSGSSREVFRRLALTSGATAVLAVVALGPRGPQPAVFVPPSTTAAATFAAALGSAEQLGASVALSADGQVALIGAPAAAGGGAAYLYVESGGTWPSTPTATFTGPPGSQGEIGTAVALSANGQVALVGAPGGGSAPSNDGAAYLYVEAAGTWSSTPTATFAGAPGSSGKLGSAVALSADGTVALVGAPVASYGAAYVYTGSGGNWSPTPAATFTGPPTTDGGGEFGSAVALSADGQVALVGAPGAGTSYDGAGYLYSESGATWPSSPTAFFPGPPGAGAEDGNSVALSANGQVALLGAPEGGPFQDGVAFIYAESGGTWPSAPAASFLGPTASDAWLGQSVALSANGQVALLGAPIGGDGAAYLYTESGGTWSTVAAATFIGPVGSPDDLGDEVALSGNGQTALLGDAPFTGADAIDGAAYLFSAPAGSEQALQTIVFTSADPSPVRSGATYNLVATSTSGLPVALSVDTASTPGACSLTGTALQFTGGGTCLVDADQEGDSAWAAAPQVQIDILIHGLPPRIAVLSSTATVDRGQIAVKLSCKNAPCSGEAELVKGAIVLANTSYSLGRSTSATIELRLTQAGSKTLAGAKEHPLTKKLVVTARGGNKATRTIRVS